jgi:LAS superfamily LD-carboxypeptidase LdcB
MIRKTILVIIVLIALPAACRTVLNGRGGKQEESVSAHTRPEETSERDETTETKPVIDVKVLLGHVDPATDARFARVAEPYAGRKGLYLLDEVYAAFVAMHQAARRDGVSLVIVSATRNFRDQKHIWQRKWTGARLVDGRNLAKTIPDPAARARAILKYSAMPGTSRHHWGTDIDINSVEPAYFKSDEGAKVYAWLAANARRFGFCQTYTAKGPARPHGYEEEPWHWSYCPIAERYLNAYDQQITYDHITGFPGAEVAPDLKVIPHYVLGINPDCRKH